MQRGSYLAVSKASHPVWHRINTPVCGDSPTRYVLRKARCHVLDSRGGVDSWPFVRMGQIAMAQLGARNRRVKTGEPVRVGGCAPQTDVEIRDPAKMALPVSISSLKQGASPIVGNIHICNAVEELQSMEQTDVN